MDFQSEKSFGKLRLRAFQPYHQILCMSKHVEDVEDRSNTHKVEDIKRAVMLCMSKTSKMGKDHTHTFWLITSLIKKFWKAETRAFQPYHQILCMSKHVEDVEDRSNTHKGCNAMYVEDVEDGKRTYTYILAHNFLNT